MFWRRPAKPTAAQSDYAAVCEARGAHCQVSLSGRITIDSAPDIRNMLLQRMKPVTCRSLTVEFRDVSYVDTSGLAVLVELLKVSHDQGKTFRLSGLRERPRYLLEATGLLPLFDGTSEKPLEDIA